MLVHVSLESIQLMFWVIVGLDTFDDCWQVVYTCHNQLSFVLTKNVVSSGHIEAVQSLIDHGADASLQNESGQSAL